MSADLLLTRNIDGCLIWIVGAFVRDNIENDYNDEVGDNRSRKNSLKNKK